MSDINLIKTVLFNAANLNEALTRFTELGIEYRACTFTDNGYHVSGHDITFWPTSSVRCPLAVCINGNFFDYDDRRSFLAGQCETVETPVPAASPDTTGQHPDSEPDNFYTSCPKCTQKTPHYIVGLYGHCKSCQHPIETFREPADRFDYDQAERDWEAHSNSLSEVRPKFVFPKKPLVEVLRLREILRNERRLKNSRVKGLSS